MVTSLPSLAERIDAVLPQTQCARCGFAGCRPYAEALAGGGTDINRCPPGGETTLRLLADLTGREATALDPACGTPGTLQVAMIDETACIGCTLCIDACPVDAILGAQKRMHAILPSLCSGCALCVDPCPVDCITMVPAGREWTALDAAAARQRHHARKERIARNERIELRGRASAAFTSDEDASTRRRTAVTEALARARARRAAAR